MRYNPSRYCFLPALTFLTNICICRLYSLCWVWASRHPDLPPQTKTLGGSRLRIPQMLFVSKAESFSDCSAKSPAASGSTWMFIDTVYQAGLWCFFFLPSARQRRNPHRRHLLDVLESRNFLVLVILIKLQFQSLFLCIFLLTWPGAFFFFKFPVYMNSEYCFWLTLLHDELYRDMLTRCFTNLQKSIYLIRQTLSWVQSVIYWRIYSPATIWGQSTIKAYTNECSGLRGEWKALICRCHVCPLVVQPRINAVNVSTQCTPIRVSYRINSYSKSIRTRHQSLNVSFSHITCVKFWCK